MTLKEQIMKLQTYKIHEGEDTVYVERDDVLKALEREPCEDWYDVPSYEMTLKQTRQAVKDLRKKLSEHLERKSCEDAISREDALMCMTGEYLADKEYKPEDIISKHIRRLRDLPPVALPSVQPKPKTGHWIRITNGAMREKYICSECGRQIEDDGIEGLLHIKYPYCHCGARMVEPQESEEKE